MTTSYYAYIKRLGFREFPADEWTFVPTVAGAEFNRRKSRPEVPGPFYILYPWPRVRYIEKVRRRP